MKKQRIFIGSSTEGLPFARRARAVLSEDFDVTLWDETSDRAVFRLNQNFLSELLRASLQFDYGLLVGTADDKVSVRGVDVSEPRDNILFEVGLFIGRIGINKCAFLIDKEIKVLSDFAGISLAKFDKNDMASFDKQVERIKGFYLQNQQSEINFFPSCTLASVYFQNFLVPVCTYIIRKNGFIINDKLHEDCAVNVIIPEKITSDVNLQFDKLKRKFKIQQASFEYDGRPRNVCIDIRKKGTKLEIIDFPTVIAGINHAIQNLMPFEFNQSNKDYEAILSRELERFCGTLTSLYKRDGFEDLICLRRESELTF